MLKKWADGCNEWPRILEGGGVEKNFSNEPPKRTTYEKTEKFFATALTLYKNFFSIF